MARKLEILPDRLSREDIMGPVATLSAVRIKEKKPWKVHWHEFFELELVLAGVGTHLVNSEPCSYRRGSFYLVTPVDFHEFIPESNSTCEAVHVKFSEHMLSEKMCHMVYSRKGLWQTVLPENEIAALEADFNRLVVESDNIFLGKEMVLRSTLERILIDLARKVAGDGKTAEPEASGAGRAGIHRVMLYIQSHFREPLSLKEMSEQANLTPSYFSVCFHKVTHTTFKNYLQELRLSFAMTLLKSSQLSVTEICYASGFNTLSHFLRTFKQRYGESPNHFRGHGHT